MVSIVEVTTKAQLRRFVDYPNQLYKDVPQFVPAPTATIWRTGIAAKSGVFLLRRPLLVGGAGRGDRGAHRRHPQPQGQ